MRYLSDYIGAVRAEQERIRESMAAGRPVSFEAYQRLVGEHQGLAKALEILDTLLEETEYDDK